MKNYYGLVASMPDVSPDDAKLNFTVADFKEDYWPQLSETDKKLVALFFLRYDHRNLLAWLAEGDGAAFDERAMFPREAWPEAMEKVKAGDEQGRLFLRVHGRVCYLERSAGTLAGRCPFGGILPLCGHVQESFYKRLVRIQPECEQYPDSPYGPEVRIQSGFLSGGRRCGDEGFGCFGSTGFRVRNWIIWTT